MSVEQLNRVRFPGWLTITLVILLTTGIVFRFVNLNHKVYWHDEVYTTMRAAGYTRGEIDQELFQNQVIAFGELQKYQHLKPGSTFGDTLRSLAVEDPQHPPLYFSIARLWMQIFINPLPSSRLLPALLSLLGLPLMYALAWELFASHEIALLTTTLLALSPFDVLFAQTARQYSLLTVAIIGSQWFLLRALRWEERGQKSSGLTGQGSRKARMRRRLAYWRDWGLYALSVAVGLYTHPFFGLTVVGQAVYLGVDGWMEGWRTAFQKPHYAHVGRMLRSFGVAIATALVLYAPWLYVLVSNRQRALATTDWAQVAQGNTFLEHLTYLAQLWVLSFTALFVDLNFDVFYQTLLLRWPFVLLIGISVYALCRRCDRSTWLFVLSSVLVPFLLLVLPDLLMGDKRSAVSRYLISCFPGVQLAVGYFLATCLSITPQVIGRKKSTVRKTIPPPSLLHPTPHPLNQCFWRGVLALLVTGSLISLTASALAYTWWNKDLSYANFQIASTIRAAETPVVVSDIGDDWTNTGDLISLSYLLDGKTPLLLASRDTNWVETGTFRYQIQGRTAFVFRPTEALRRSLEQAYGPLQPASPAGGRFWKLNR